MSSLRDWHGIPNERGDGEIIVQPENQWIALLEFKDPLIGGLNPGEHDGFLLQQHGLVPATLGLHANLSEPPPERIDLMEERLALLTS
ncbi:hypothetical protein [Microbacterium hydrocarbonoxydans]|uniref:hypothetical protein n=1 Tax=Microbacterium hydrocarbonoxydans TaxID=273678 RepID=UPI001269A69D|nr:hypothetical protein [Microbacterium hydrocarbonoxydans]